MAPGASPTIEYLHVVSGTANSWGGIYSPYGYFSGGGGIYAAGTRGSNDTITIRNCVIEDNSASEGNDGLGGGVYLNYRSNAVLTNNTIWRNKASDGWGSFTGGGGLYIGGSNGVNLSNNIIAENRATIGSGRGLGAGAYIVGADNFTASANKVYGNIGNETGGLEVRFCQSPRLTGNTIYNNVAGTYANGVGGGVTLFACDDATVQGNAVYSNTATTNASYIGIGGGIYFNEANRAAVSNNSITGNVANSGGGSGTGGGLAIYKSQQVNVSNNLVLDNVSTPSANPQFMYDVGGGVRVSFGSLVTLTNNIIAGNRAPGGGGGVHVVGYLGVAPVDSTQATLWHNTVADNAQAGLALTGKGEPRGQAAPGQASRETGENTISSLGELLLMAAGRQAQPGVSPGRVQTQAEAQGLLVSWNATLNAVNNIVSGHTLGISVTMPVSSTTTMDYTLWNNTSNYSVGVTHSNDRSGAPAFVNPAGRNYHITASSAARDAGTNAGVTTDIDGNARPQGAGYDIGADEYVP